MSEARDQPIPNPQVYLVGCGHPAATDGATSSPERPCSGEAEVVSRRQEATTSERHALGLSRSCYDESLPV